MDLRTIMNADAAGTSNPPPATQLSSSPSDPSHHQRAHQSYPENANRPPQPPPQHIQRTSPESSSPYASTQSPYQQFHAAPPPLNTAVQSHPSQSPPHVSTPYGPGARDPYGASTYNSRSQHPTAPMASPYTPQPMSAGPQHPEQQSYFAQQRSHSLQSVMTNPRPMTQDSPSSTSQPLPSHQFSPPGQRSVPGTPLGPAPTFVSRQSPSSARPLSSGHDSPRNQMSSPRPMHETHTRSPMVLQPSSPAGSRPSDLQPQYQSYGMKQESGETTSPRAVSRQNSTATTSDVGGAAPLRSSEDRKWNESPTTPFPSAPSTGSRVSPITATQPHITSSPSAPRSGSHPLKMEVDSELRTRVESQQPRPKRRRYNEPPIYAQRSLRNKGKCPIVPNPQPPIPKHVRGSDRDFWASRRQSAVAVKSALPSAPSRPALTSGPPPSTNGPPVRPFVPSTPPVGLLGPWEPSITGFIPYEEITKMLCDFLFQHVVMRNDVAAGPAGSAAVGQGAIIEVEAKLGHIMDKDRNERLLLPILTESVVNRENPQFRTAFESSMTVEQHRAMNNFLNEAVKNSMSATDSKRIPISYAHKKERDTFYEVSAAELPPVIRQNLNPRHKPRVRVTTDARTGEVIAKIVKCRVADIDVSSPRTTVDWRVSVNLEMEYPGDVHNLPVLDMKGGRGERNKDRMSYRHLAYQIDLTQVAKADPPTRSDFEHELEVEISAAEIRRQGQLAMTGDPKNQYEELVKGFVDNIRVLARAVPP